MKRAKFGASEEMKLIPGKEYPMDYSTWSGYDLLCGKGYELILYKDRLQPVRLNASGLEKIAAYYNNKYGTDIVVEKIDFPLCKYVAFQGREEFGTERPEIIKRILAIVSNLEPSKAKGCVLVFHNRDGFLMHSSPLFISKDADGKATVVSFEEHQYGLRRSLEGKDISVIGVRETFGAYGGNQRDGNSCSVFAINTLKHCFDAEFIRSIGEAKAKWLTFSGSGEAIYEKLPKIDKLPKTSLDHIKKGMKGISSEKQEVYFREEEPTVILCFNLGKEMRNDTAFYKSHDFAQRFLNPEHKTLLNERTLERLREIDKARGKFTFSNPQEIELAAVGSVLRERDVDSECKSSAPEPITKPSSAINNPSASVSTASTTLGNGKS
jgi:hypothetical protein